MFMANFALYTQNHLALSDQTTSYLLTYAGILLILVQVVGIRWLTKRYPELKIVFYAAFFVTASLLGLSLTSSVGSLMILLLPMAMSGGVLNTVINSLITKSVEQDQVGVALGLATSMESLAWIIAPVLGGALIGFWGGEAFSIVAGVLAGLMIPYIRLALTPNTKSVENIA
jgi:DHA1 family tetracycline resistance protein-like MFS transporter